MAPDTWLSATGRASADAGGRCSPPKAADLAITSRPTRRNRSRAGHRARRAPGGRRRCARGSAGPAVVMRSRSRPRSPAPSLPAPTWRAGAWCWSIGQDAADRVRFAFESAGGAGQARDQQVLAAMYALHGAVNRAISSRTDGRPWAVPGVDRAVAARTTLLDVGRRSNDRTSTWRRRRLPHEIARHDDVETLLAQYRRSRRRCPARHDRPLAVGRGLRDVQDFLVRWTTAPVHPQRHRGAEAARSLGAQRSSCVLPRLRRRFHRRRR